jgi:hypothetical protein
MRTLYKDRTMTVGEAKAKINGKHSKFLKIVKNDVIVVLPVIGEEIIMERQYRPVIGKYIYELPAGHIEKGESKVSAVKREMLEGRSAKYSYIVVVVSSDAKEFENELREKVKASALRDKCSIVSSSDFLADTQRLA